AGLMAASLSGGAIAATVSADDEGHPVDEAKEDRLADGTTIFGRSIALHISDRDAMGWATIGNGDPTDEVWLDRSFDGGETVADSRLGYATIPDGGRGTSTLMYNVDDKANGAQGVLRACGKAGNRPDIVCTDWTKVEKPRPKGSRAQRAVEAL